MKQYKFSVYNPFFNKIPLEPYNQFMAVHIQIRDVGDSIKTALYSMKLFKHTHREAITMGPKGFNTWNYRQ